VRATEQKRRPAHDVAARSCPSDPAASVATATCPCFSRLPSLFVLVRAAGLERHGCTVNVSLGVGGSPLCCTPLEFCFPQQPQRMRHCRGRHCRSTCDRWRHFHERHCRHSCPTLSAAESVGVEGLAGVLGEAGFALDCSNSRWDDSELGFSDSMAGSACRRSALLAQLARAAQGA